MEAQARYKALLGQAIQLAESKFNGVVVSSEKNILLIKKTKRVLFPGQQFMTIAVDLHDLSFHWGNYDLTKEQATTDFQLRVENSWFNIDIDVPPLAA